MAEEFAFSVPINFSGSSSATTGGGNGETKKLNKGIKGLTAGVLQGNVLSKVLKNLFEGLNTILTPLLKVLNVLFVTIFMPLMPLIKLLIGAISFLIKIFTGGYGTVAEMLGKVLLGLLAAVAAYLLIGIAPIIAIVALVVIALGLLWDPIVELAKLIWKAVKVVAKFIADIGVWIWEFILDAFDFIKNIGLLIWEQIIKPAFSFLSDVGKWIWEQILVPAFSFLKDIGKWIWDIIKSPFVWLAEKVNNIVEKIRSVFKFGGGRATGGSVMSGTTYMVGERGPELFTPSTSGSITPNNALGGKTEININATVRNQQDINKIANEVSKVMYRQNRGRFS